MVKSYSSSAPLLPAVPLTSSHDLESSLAKEHALFFRDLNIKERNQHSSQATKTTRESRKDDEKNNNDTESSSSSSVSQVLLHKFREDRILGNIVKVCFGWLGLIDERREKQYKDDEKCLCLM